jgi:hypothetical protein
MGTRYGIYCFQRSFGFQPKAEVEAELGLQPKAEEGASGLGFQPKAEDQAEALDRAFSLWLKSEALDD